MAARKQHIKALVLAAAKERYAAALPQDVVCIAPFSPSPMEMVVQVWERLRPHVTAADLVVELGCGDARWIIYGVQTFGCRAVGIEYDPKVAALAMDKVREVGLDASIEISIGDIVDPAFRLPAKTSIVIVYAFAETLNVNIKRLLAQSPPHTTIISVGFHVQGWTPSWSDRYVGLLCYVYDIDHCQ
ncbi:Aste57867_10746 [Aphanomyces stellatus]|uniref:Aste57867_10746 protein n=1 Tax=Aphanomyces stellatus TaxID=120398 RepID=A0A485KRS1_9STRA|nr:hypothetical protein As57867_010706 [Aphanomyces stellatus]VFT87616.1 Aste57867_10746 [Aphanomyces stellatus]